MPRHHLFQYGEARYPQNLQKAMSNECAPSFTGEVPSLPDFIGFFWKQ